MSESGQIPQDTKTAEIVALASAWLERRDGDDWTDADQGGLDAWLAKSLGNQVEFWRVEAAWKRADRLGALRSPGHRSGRAQFWPLLFGAAAVFVGVVVLAIGRNGYLSPSNEKTYRTPIGGHEIITLTDGSKVELNTDTVLRTEIGARYRTAVLEKGEAYFSIRHDSIRPFVVSAAGHRITDLGTKFLVRNSGGALEVALVEGSAKFESADAWIQQHFAVLTPGDVVVATASSMSEVRKAPQQLLGDLGWRRGVIVLHRTALADAVAEFNRYNTQKLAISNPDVGELMLGGTFPIHDVEAFTRVAQQVFGLKVERRNGEILISR